LPRIPKRQLDENRGRIPIGPDKNKHNPLALFLGSIDSVQRSDDEESKEQD